MQPSQYLSVQELLSAPLGLDLRDLPARGAQGPGGVSGAAWYAELSNVILRASAMGDAYCQQILGTTLDAEEVWTDGRRAGVDQNGYLWLQTGNFPVISVASFQFGWPATGGTAWTTPALGDILIGGPRGARLVYPGGFARRGTPPLRVQCTYLNGYPNCLLTGSVKVAAGSTTLPLSDLTGFVAGQRVTIYDSGNTEVVTVAAPWTPATGAGNLSLAAGTLFDHTPTQRSAVTAPNQASEIRVSTLPADINQAMILICKALIETRGASALVMGKVGGGVAGRAGGEGKDSYELPEEAAYLLDPYQRII